MEDPSATNAQKGPELADPSSPPTTKQNVFTFIRQFLMRFYPRILMLVVFILAMVLSDATGCLYAATTIISLVLEQVNNWRYVYVSYMMISVAAVAGQIYFLIDPLPNQEAADISSWFGLALNFDKQAVKMLLINVSILLLSILGLIVSLWEIDIMSDEEFKHASEKYRPILRSKAKDGAQAEKDDSSDEDILSSLEDVSAEDKEQLRNDFQYIQSRFRFKAFDKTLSDLYHVHGYELSLFVLLIVAFYRLNAISILYVFISWYFSFSCKYFYDQQKYAKNLRNLKWTWRVIYTFLALDLMRQYFFLIWFPLSWNIPRTFSDATFSCDIDSKRSYSRLAPYSSTSDYENCISGWREWLSLDNFSSGELIMNFINILMFVNYDRYFTAYVSFRPEDHSPGDERDFTDPRRRSFIRDIKFMYYCHFFFVPLFLFVMIGVKAGITGQTDVISCLYFFMGLYLIFAYKTLLKKRNKLWGVIETVNNVMLLLIVCFQVPIVPCPLALPDRYYFSVNECIALQTQYNAENQNTLLEINNSVVWYNIIDIVGINKVAQLSFATSYKEILMILFYFIAFIQRKIWNHGYLEAYVIPYYEKKSRYNYEIAAMYVEQVHFIKKVIHAGLLLDEEIAKYHEKKLEDKLKGWEKLFKVDFNADEIKEAIEDEEEGISKADISRKDKAMAIAEKIMPKVPEIKILPTDALVELAERCEYDEAKMLEEIYPELDKATRDIVNEIREIKKINLPREQTGQVAEGSASVYLDKEYQKEDTVKEEGEEGKQPEAEEHKENDKLVAPEDAERPSPIKYSSGGFFKHDGIRPIKYEAEKEEDFKYKVKKFLVNLSQGSSFISDWRTIATPDDSFLFILIQVFIMHIEKVTFFVFIMNFIVNVNLLALVFPLSLLVYGVIEFPVPTRGYWNGMLIYTLVVILLKFLYQLPFFCGTPIYSFNDIFDIETYNCAVYYGDPWYLPFRLDYIIGIRKFTGDSSYPVNQGLFRGIIWDLLALCCLLGVRSMLDARGIWNHMRIYRSFKYVPQLEDKPKKKKKSQYSHNEPAENAPESGEVNEPEPSQRKENIKKEPKGVKKILRNMFSLNPFAVGSTLLRKPGHDYYAVLAILSLVILVYFLFFFSMMVGSSRSLSQEISKSNFSGDVVLAAIAIILVMVTERALYVMRENYFQAEKRLQNPDETDREDLGDDVEQVVLSKPFFWKIVTHYLLVVVVHVFFFLVMVNGLGQENVNNFGAIAIGYILCAVYMFISALQIKYGYTLDIQTTFFNKTDTVTKTLFKVYRAVPFLFEITSILDWTVLKTALDLFSWMKCEDARANLYLVKCEMEGRRKHAIGQAQGRMDKFLFGFCLGFLLIFLIILPLLLFSTLNPDQQYNNVTGGKVSMQFYASGENINNEVTIYEVNNLSIDPITEDEFKYLQSVNGGLESYEMPQLQKVEVSTFSEQQWLISPPSMQLLQDFLADTTVDVYVSFTWQFSRNGDMVQGSNSRLLSDATQQDIYNMLEATSGQTASTQVLNLFPKFLALSRNSFTEILGANLYTEQGLAFSGDAKLSYVNDPDGKYWTLENSYENDNYQEPVFSGDNVVLILASDKTMGSLFSSLGSLGIVGFYVTVVLAVGRIVRTLFEKTSQRVIYEEMPQPEDLIDLCNAILIARRQENLVKEEELYLTLIRIFRSPEMLLELTGSRLKDQAKATE